MDDRKIHFGLPTGSLNTYGRADTESLLVEAGYEIIGYTPGKENSGRLAIANDTGISPYLVKARNVPGDLSRRLLDIGITGDDCIENWPGGSSEFLKLADLEYGAVDVVVAVPEDCEIRDLTDLFLSTQETGEPLTFYTEYVILTKNYILNSEGYRELFPESSPVTEIWGYREGDNTKVQIIYSAGATEEYLRRGFPIVDNSQSGMSLERAGGRKLEVIMKATAGLYSRQDLETDSWKAEKTNEIKELLVGVVNGRKHYDVKFNVEPDTLDQILEFLNEEGLSLKGPTVSELLDASRSTIGYAVNIAVPKSR
ncbi:MAG: ATP phosphoribosyltransferase, partial [Dehalococcoidia bacterium]